MWEFHQKISPKMEVGFGKTTPVLTKFPHFLFFFIETSLNIFFWKLAFDDDYGDWHCHLVARFRHVDKPDRCFVNSPFRNLEHMETRKNLFSSDEKDDSVVQPGSHLIILEYVMCFWCKLYNFRNPWKSLTWQVYVFKGRRTVCCRKGESCKTTFGNVGKEWMLSEIMGKPFSAASRWLAPPWPLLWEWI